MYSYGPPHMAVQKQADQHEHTFSSNVRIRDVVLKTCLGRWTIGRSGERGPAWHDDDHHHYVYVHWLDKIIETPGNFNAIFWFHPLFCACVIVPCDCSLSLSLSLSTFVSLPSLTINPYIYIYILYIYIYI